MIVGTRACLERVLDQLTAAGGSQPAGELARRLLSLSDPVDDGLGRRLVASALGWSVERLPHPLEAQALRRVAHGPAAGLLFHQAEFVVVDLETTGVTVGRATILEIGAVRVRGLRAVERFQTLVDPGRPIPAGITALTGIDAEAVTGAPPLSAAIAGFHSWLERAPGAPFVAHNAGFDERFVRRAFADHGLPPLDRAVLCTRKLSRRIVPELGRYGLDALSAHFGISNPARHRALGDAQATARALVELLQRARQTALARTLGDLLDLQATPPARIRGTPDPAGSRNSR